MTDLSRGPRIEWSGEQGFAHVADEVFVLGEDALDRLKQLGDELGDADWEVDEHGTRWFRVSQVRQPLPLIRALQAEGHVAQPNHVFSAHGCAGGCGPHPSIANAMYRYMSNPYAANPYAANPYAANPYAANPYAANPYAANPYAANPYAANRPPENTAIPMRERALPQRSMVGAGKPPVVAVLDTGLAVDRPVLMANVSTVTGAADHPDVDLFDATGQLRPADNWLDPVAGHGTFIAGIIEQLAPGCRIHVGRVLSPFGLATEADVATAIDQLRQGKYEGLASVPDVIALSFGGPVMGTANLLGAAVQKAIAKGILVVASAGNAATCEPQYPAAFDGVLAVGAIGPDGPAPWTNYGDWVDVCAPGVDLVSSFFASFDGDHPMKNTVDVDRFEHWARWSGTSFAVPVVVAAIAREMVAGQASTGEVVKRLVDAPHLLRLPCLGTVINI